MKWHSCLSVTLRSRTFPLSSNVTAHPGSQGLSNLRELFIVFRLQVPRETLKNSFFFGRWPIITFYCCSVNNILYRTCQYNVAVVADAMCSKAKARTRVEASLKGDPLEMPGKRESSSRPLPFLHDIMTLRFPMRRRAVVAKNERRRESSSSCHIQSLIMHNWFACSRFQLLNLLHHHGW